MKKFKDLVYNQLHSKPSAYTPKANSEPLAEQTYSKELKFKANALKEFWQKNELPSSTPKITPSPIARKYRTTSKRRVQPRGKKFELFTATNDKADFVYLSKLEPQTHLDLFKWVANWLNEERNAFIGRRMNWVTIRGHEENKLHLILNLTHLDGSSMKAFKKLSENLPKQMRTVLGAGLFLDPDSSDYYLDAKSNANGKAYKHLFGPNFLVHEINEIPWRYPNIGFSQINQRALPDLVQTIDSWIKKDQSKELLDLYCGYGFFSVSFSERFSKVLGIDWTGPSIEMARKNATFQKKNHLRFLSRDITNHQIADIPNPNYNEVIILDPPKQGTNEGVIEGLAHRQPAQVFHVFCGIDSVPAALKEWDANGYKPVKHMAFDFFPGTANLELLILLEAK